MVGVLFALPSYEAFVDAMDRAGDQTGPVCPLCGAPLDIEPNAVVEEPVIATGTGRIVRRARPCVAAFCTGCEYCVEVRRDGRA